MKQVVSLSALLVLAVFPVCLETGAAGQAAANQHQEMVKTYCVTCHSTRAKMGGLALEGLNLQTATDNAEIWKAAEDAVVAGDDTRLAQLLREHEKMLRARITSAQPLTDEQRAEIVAALESRYGKKIEADVDVDPALLGGARVQVGDQVIHASMRDALAQMAAALAR